MRSFRCDHHNLQNRCTLEVIQKIVTKFIKNPFSPKNRFLILIDIDEILSMQSFKFTKSLYFGSKLKKKTATKFKNKHFFAKKMNFYR